MKKILFVLGLVASLVLLNVSVLGSGLALAMASGMYSSDMKEYRTLLDKKINLTTWNKSIWSQFMGYIGGQKSIFDTLPKYATPLNLKPTGSPLEVLQDFMHNGGVDMDIPIYYPLTGKGISGTMTLVGKGERPKIATKNVKINQERHAYLAQDSKMSRQALQNPAVVKQLMDNASSYLGDWFHRWNAYQPYLAFLEGSSENLTRIAAKGGLGITRASHMNIYVAGAGKVAFSNTAATYEAAVASAINGLTDTSSDYFSTDVIENMVYAARHNHRIAPVSIGGLNLYVIVISDAQARQLQQDTKWNDAAKNAAERSIQNNPLYTGQIAGVYGGALILIDECTPSVYTSSDASQWNLARSTTGDANGVMYGLTDTAGDATFMSTPVDPGNKKAAILFGKSAICVGMADDVSLEEEFYDFKQKKEVGADMIVGYQRADILDTDGYFGVAGDKRYENTSSLIALTYSPSDGKWA